MEDMNNEHSNNITALHQAMFSIANDAWDVNAISDEQFLEISTALGKVWALNLPQHAENVSRETYSPESRIRLEGDESTNMDNTNNKENNMNIEEALKTLVEHITQQVTDTMEARLVEAMESTVADAVSDALDDYNPTEHGDFEDAVQQAMQGVSITITGQIDL